VVFAQLLRDSLPEDNPRREDVANIIAEALHCREVLSSLQGFARQREPQWEQTQLSEIVQRALQEMQPKLEGSGVTVRLQLAENLPTMLADPAQLAQVLVNLLTNSLEAMAGAGEIVVETRLVEEGRSVEVVVRDNGRGFDPELLPKVFQPFVTTKSGGLGTGLGLAVAHGIVHSHGGDIQVRSKLGHGATVTLRLPLYLTHPKVREAIKVLVVDDDPDFLEQHRLMLSGMGFEVVTAERTDEALDVAQREIPDAFVLDLMMEKTDSGARLARALRRDPRFREAPIIMLTSVVHDMGFQFDRNPKEVLDWMKADAWFDKPAPMAELAATLRRLLAGPEGEGEAQAEGPRAGPG
jgi:CheY-like chemotaxis protein